ncbi:MAG: LacI family DNA-binding transcriptional regulator [Caulobacteraceae bacterium]
MKVTLHEVAARAGVSIATVSRALNGLPVSAENRARVEAAVADLGYVANEAARSLRAERTMTLGVVFHDLANTLGIELLDALSEAVEGAGYSLLITTARGDLDRYDLLMRRFLERRIDAVFAIRPRGGGAQLARYEAAGIPVLTLFSGGGAYADLPCLAPTFAKPAKELADHLIGLGHRRIALVAAAGEAMGGPMRSIAETLKGRGLEAVTAEPSSGGGMNEMLAALMQGPDRPTCLVAVDPNSRTLLGACQALGLAVPGDVSLVAISEIAHDNQRRGRDVTSVVIDPHNMGRAAGAAMLAWLAGQRPPGRVRVDAGFFAARASTGPAPPMNSGAG